MVLTVISADPDEATVSPTVLTFSPADWNFPQTVTVTGVDDHLIDGSQLTLVTVSVADDVSDGNFAEVGDQAVSVTTTDNDVAGFVLSKTTLTVSEAGSTDTFTIVLTAQPDSSVTLAAIGGDAGEATVSPAVLTFAPDDWDVPQTVTVTGVDDHRIDGSQDDIGDGERGRRDLGSPLRAGCRSDGQRHDDGRRRGGIHAQQVDRDRFGVGHDGHVLGGADGPAGNRT